MPVPSRKQGGRTAKDYTLVIAYDGERTEDSYFRGWKLIIPPSRLSIVPLFVNSGGNPLIAVRKSITEKRKIKNFAEFWCVCDCDNADAKNIAQAKEEAERNGIKICLSNRCFEVWILLHWCKSTAEISNEEDAIARVKAYYPNYSKKSKTVPFNVLLPRTEDALINAAWLSARNLINPNTMVHGLVKKLKENLA